MIDFILQAGIMFFTMAAVQGITSDNYRFYGSLAGVIAQPFWLMVCIPAGQWGPASLAMYFLFTWSKSSIKEYKLWRKR